MPAALISAFKSSQIAFLQSRRSENPPTLMLGSQDERNPSNSLCNGTSHVHQTEFSHSMLEFNAVVVGGRRDPPLETSSEIL